MNQPMLIVFGILAGAVALWSWGRPRADIVAVLIVLGLMLSGVLTPQESLANPGAIRLATTSRWGCLCSS